MPFPNYPNPKWSDEDAQLRCDIYEARKPYNYALDVRQMKQSTQVCGELCYIAVPPSAKPNIK